MHMLDPWQLKAFLAAASAGSLRRAAEAIDSSGVGRVLERP